MPCWKPSSRALSRIICASARADSSICSASSRASCASMRRGGGGAGGSWSNANASSATKLDELFIITLRLARDGQRTGVLELADDADDAALRLLHHGAALRRQDVELL